MDVQKTMLLIWVGVFGIALGAESSKEAQRLESASFVVNEIMQTREGGIPQELLDKAVCVGVIPSQLKFALGIGGNYGRGVLVCRQGGTGPWGAPSMFTTGGASYGLQLGGEAIDVVFLVMNSGGTRKLIESHVKLGVDASAAVGPVGRSAEGATDAQMHAEILSYSRSRGLFAGVSLDGAVLHQDKGGNQRLYGRSVTAHDILIASQVNVPPAAKPLDDVLTRYSPRGGSAFPKT